MRSINRHFLPILILLLAALGCRFAARLSPVNIIKTASAPTPTITPILEDTIKRQATATLSPTASLTPTATPDFSATETVVAQSTAIRQTDQAQPMAEQVQALKEDGYLSSTNGVWTKVDDFDQSWAETDGYRWWNTGTQPVDFVIQANVEWWSAETTTYLFNAGCGFVFRAEDQNNFFAALFTLDGKARFDQRFHGDWLTPILSDPISTHPMNDRTQIMLIVEGNRLIFFKDDEAILDVTDVNLTSPESKGGDLAIALRSASDIGYGLRCKLTDIGLWIIN